MPVGGLSLVEYVHPEGLFSVPVPDGWERVEGVPGVALVAVEPVADRSFKPNLVVTVERLVAGVTLEGWVSAAVGLLPEHLTYYQLLDVEWTAVGGLPTGRVLAHHAVDVRTAVTMEQWLVMDGTVGYTLTASVGTADYTALADLFAACAGGFRPGAGAAG